MRREFESFSLCGAGGYGGDSFFLYWDIGAAIFAAAGSDQEDGVGPSMFRGFV
jgi:hypothetical protein